MVDLKQLIDSLPAGLGAKKAHGELTGEIVSVTGDSRQVSAGSLFVAVRGNAVDGHDYLAQAVDRGCRCIVAEEDPGPLHGVAIVVVRDGRAALGVLSAAWQGYPARSMTMIALTGTNGKTTVSWLLEQTLRSCGFRVGVIGTVNYRYPDHAGAQVVERASLTTPDPVVLQQLLRTMADEGVTHVVMEASSHALAQHRLEGVLFDLGVFTNLSRDHLDFHGTMEDYFAAKKLLFTGYLKPGGRAVIVTDTAAGQPNWGRRLIDELNRQGGIHQILSCGSGAECSVSADDVVQDIRGLTCTLFLKGEKRRFHCRLNGRYNLLNVLAAAGAGDCLGLSLEQIVAGLAMVDSVPGRLERIVLPGAGEQALPTVFVDYAHTPDALKNVLQTLRELATGRVICVFGCGGERDMGKRSQMGAVAAELADIAIITSDNPRSEDPAAIIKAITAGVCRTGLAEVEAGDLMYREKGKGFVAIGDRRTAIHLACGSAGRDDIVLIAGKGHEDYQLLAGGRIFFDDRIEAVNGLLRWNRRHLLAATGGQVVSGHSQGLLNAVATDSRTVAEGDIFVALAGETFDGHDFLETAARAGAGAVIVEQEVGALPPSILVIRVPDTLRALGDLAAYRRRLLGSRLQVAAITGSSGKTTVKEMTAAIFRRHLHAGENGADPLLKTAGNFNNLIGLPLSLLPVCGVHRVAVLEMGMNRFGEIRRLTEIADPDIGCIVNVQAAHLEGLGNIEGVARAKGELFAGMRRDAVAVINCDDRLVRRLQRNAGQSIGFAVTPDGRRQKPEVRVTRIVNLGERGMRFTLHIRDRQQRLTVRTPGMHTVSNCAAAAAIGVAADIDPETIVAALSRFQSTDKRMQFVNLPGGINLLNDCYNANPSSMAAALKTVSGFGSNCRRIALLGDMLELGNDAADAHEEIGRLVAKQGYDQLAVTGAHAGDIIRGACNGGMTTEKARQFASTAEMAAWLYKEVVDGRLGRDDWLLLKGSRGMRMEGVLDELERCFAVGIETGGE